MIDFKNNTVGESPEKQQPIHNWEVWFMTPNGLVKTIQEALQVVIDLLGDEVNPNMYLYPVPVAITERFYEAFRR